MIQWVYERAAQARSVEEVRVATDDIRVKEAVESFGGTAVMTSPDHPSGTDRIAEALGDGNPDVVINVQGDEPLIEPAAIDQLVSLFDCDPRPRIGTLCTSLSREEAQDPARVKVVFDTDGNALYFSRSPIPYPRDGQDGEYYLHLGIYAYTPETLKTFVNLPCGRLEKLEKLEQLRALENGINIKVAVTEHSSFGVDTPEDVKKIEKKLLAAAGMGSKTG